MRLTLKTSLGLKVYSDIIDIVNSLLNEISGICLNVHVYAQYIEWNTLVYLVSGVHKDLNSVISNNREWWFLSTIAVPYLQAFFRRAITDKNKYACLKENSCEITAQKRGNCSACRLQKCFDLGMSKSGQFHEAIVKI